MEFPKQNDSFDDEETVSNSNMNELIGEFRWKKTHTSYEEEIGMILKGPFYAEEIGTFEYTFMHTQNFMNDYF